MNSEHGRSGRREQGPQGTQVFSRDEVNQLIDEAHTDHASAPRAELTGISVSVSGQSYALSAARLIVGRSERCDLHIDDPSVSSEHARLVRDADGWRVVNLLSTNGTFVNEQKVSSSPLESGDRIRFGGVEFKFYDPDGKRSETSGSWWPWIGAAAAVVAVIALLIWLS
jgi:hypothetical protein